MFNSIDKFIKTTYNLDTNLVDQLLKFQRNYFIDYKDLQALPKTETYDYDFLGFILDGSDLNTPTAYHFDTMEDKSMSMDRFLENMHYARKRNFGKTIITRNQICVDELA